MKNSKKKCIIFDFDGVIVESLDIKTDAFKEIYKPYGVKIVNKVAKYHKENGGISRYNKFNYYHSNYLGIDLSVAEKNKLSLTFSNIVKKKVSVCPYVKGALEFIKSSSKIYDLYISSATPKEELFEIVSYRRIDHYFQGIYGSPESKSDHIKTIIKYGKYNKSDILFVGDAVTDYEAAKKMDIHFILRNTHASINFSFKRKVDQINDFSDFNNIIDQLFDTV